MTFNPNFSSSLVRLSLASKGRLSEDSMAFLQACGLSIDKPNPRQYQASIRNLDELMILFQRPGDIVASVRDGSVDFGISGLDVIAEHQGNNGDILILHDALGFGQCNLALAVPENWQDVTDIASLKQYAKKLGQPLRIATKFPNLTQDFLSRQNIAHTLISAEGTLETAPTIGYADMISDLVASGQTLRDNRLRQLSDGVIIKSQAALIANIHALKNNPKALHVARYLLEYFEAYLRARDNLAVFANMRGTSPEEIAKKIFQNTHVSGLQGPTISQVFVQEQNQSWYAVNIIVRRSELFQVISDLRSIGGSGVVVQPVNYIFEEEPPRYNAMLKALNKS